MKKDICKEKVRVLFFNYYNRPNKTPLPSSVVQRKLENRYAPWTVNEALKKLEKEDILRSLEAQTKFAGLVRYYFPSKIVKSYDDEKKIIKKTNAISKQIDRYSHPRIAYILGKHLHALVRNELRFCGFKILEEGRVNSYKRRKWEDTKHNLDILAEHEEKNLTIGVEVKNSLDIMDKSEIIVKIKICKKLKITPVFACRWLEPYKLEIIGNNGFPWQFKIQMFPVGFERFVSDIKKRFGFPMGVRTEIPEKSRDEFKEWVETA